MSENVSFVEDNKVEISTKRLLLRGASDTDSGGLYGAFSDSEVMRYWSTLPHTSEAQTMEWVEKMIQSPQNGVTDFIICVKPHFVPIGKIGVWQDQEVGFLLARSHWGQGLAAEALRAVIPYFFKERGMSEITADTDPRNVASIGLLKKVGFEVFDFKEKTYEIGGVWVDIQKLQIIFSPIGQYGVSGVPTPPYHNFGALKLNRHLNDDVVDMSSYAAFQASGRTPMRFNGPQRSYATYVSPYGPKTKHVPNLMGVTPIKALRYGYIASGFGVAAGVFALFFFGEVPRVRQDILSKVPVIGNYWVREVPPEDNPF